MTRTFSHKPAAREKIPVLFGIVGPSGTGKTFSALRVAAGFQRVSGGRTFLIDTEARRALQYAHLFKFEHVVFGAPFGPPDYLDVIEYCLNEGATTIVIDSMSHEHEGPGGVLEMHDVEHERLGGAPKDSIRAWGKPKAQRRRLINAIIQMPCNFVFCFRAKDKIKPVKGSEPKHLGWTAIAGEEFIYELTAKVLLLPGANGVPSWKSDFDGERALMKLPEQFKATFADPTMQLSESVGEQMARWAAGGVERAAITGDELVGRYQACTDEATFEALEAERAGAWPKLQGKERVKLAKDACRGRLDDAAAIARAAAEAEASQDGHASP